MGPQEEMQTAKMYKTYPLKGMMGEDVLSNFGSEWNP